MKTKEMKVEDLEGMSAPVNVNRMTERQLKDLQASLIAFGPVVPIVLNTRTGHIVGGHQRVTAAKAAGIKTLPVVEVNFSEVEERQLGIALNRIHGEPQEAVLAAVLRDLEAAGADIAITGYDEAEAALLLAQGDQKEAAPEGDGGGATAPGAVISFTLVFETEDEQREWYDFLTKLKARYGGEGLTTAGRVLQCLRDADL